MSWIHKKLMKQNNNYSNTLSTSLPTTSKNIRPHAFQPSPHDLNKQSVLNKKQNNNLQLNNFTSSFTHNLSNVKEIYNNFKIIDKQNLIQPSSFDLTITEIYNDIKTFKQFNITPILAILTIISNENFNYQSINIKDILPRTWRFISSYSFINKIIFYEQLALLNEDLTSEKLIKFLYVFYAKHMNYNDQLFIINMN